MNSITALGSLLALAVIAIVISSLANEKFLEATIKKRSLSALKTRALQLQEVLQALARTTCQPTIQRALGECMIDTLKDIKDIEPQHHGIDVVIEAAKQLNSLPPKALIDHDGPASSDNEIKALQRYILGAIAQVKKLPELGRITVADSQDWVVHLHMLYVQVEVDAHIMQGNKALGLGDKGDASTHYRIAQTTLIRSKYHRGPEHKEEIERVGKMIREVFVK